MARGKAMAGFLAVGALVAVSACGGSDDSAQTATSRPEAEATETPDADTTTTLAPIESTVAQGAIGETLTFGGGGNTQCCSLTVRGLTDPYPTSELNPVFHPEADERVIAVDLEFGNLTSGDMIPVHVADLRVRDSADSFYASTTMLGGGELENSVAPGQSFKSSLLYNVDITATELRLEFTPTASGPLAVVALS